MHTKGELGASVCLGAHICRTRIALKLWSLSLFLAIDCEIRGSNFSDFVFHYICRRFRDDARPLVQCNRNREFVLSLHVHVIKYVFLNGRFYCIELIYNSGTKSSQPLAIGRQLKRKNKQTLVAFNSKTISRYIVPCEYIIRHLL